MKNKNKMSSISDGPKKSDNPTQGKFVGTNKGTLAAVHPILEASLDDAFPVSIL